MRSTMVIDFHSHAFPDKLAESALQSLLLNAQSQEDIFGKASTYTNGTAAGLLASAKRAGIDCSVVLPIATSPKPSKTINDFAAALDRTTGLRSFGSVHPLNPERRKELARIAGMGLRGIKLHPEYQGCYADSEAMIATVREATEEGLWVILHAGKDIGMPPPVHCTPKQVIRLREAVPDARLILAHFGGYLLWEEVLESLMQMQVWVDTSFCLPNHPEKHSLFAQIIRKNGIHRVLFGTDSPWADQTLAVKTTREFLLKYHFTKTETEAIMGINALQILQGTVPTSTDS